MYTYNAEIVKGTKRLKGIKGTVSGTGKALTPY
jgi:hypothetical protein